MTARFKQTFAWITSSLLIFTVWTIRYQIETIVFALALGIIGTLLMFATEFGYSYRKSGLIKIGRVETWLRVHVALGIAGPVVILVHTRLNFYGFAGALAALTLTVFCSGIVGRYIYKRVSRDARSKPLLAKWRKLHIPLTMTLFLGIMIHVSSVLYFGRVLP